METQSILSYLEQLGSQDPLLAQIEYDMGEMLLPLLVAASAYQVGLENSILIEPMMYWIVHVVNDLEALKSGSARDQEAFNSPSCQNILGFFTTPQYPGLESLYETASQGDRDGTANIIYTMEILGTYDTDKSGLLGQIRLFLDLFPPKNPS